MRPKPIKRFLLFEMATGVPSLHGEEASEESDESQRERERGVVIIDQEDSNSTVALPIG